MTNRQVTINGPGTGKPVFDKRTASLISDTLFELPDGRWGIKFQTGAVIFANRGCAQENYAVTFDQLSQRADLRKCMLLPGKVEITYTPASSAISPEGIAAVVRGEIYRQNQLRRDRD